MKNYVVMGGAPITVDISDLDNNTYITFGASFVNDTASTTYGANEKVTVSTIKTWTSAHVISIGVANSELRITYSNGKMSITCTGGKAMYSVTIND